METQAANNRVVFSEALARSREETFGVDLISLFIDWAFSRSLQQNHPDPTSPYIQSGIFKPAGANSKSELLRTTAKTTATPDWAVVDAHHVRLRTERAGTGSGPFSTITHLYG